MAERTQGRSLTLTLAILASTLATLYVLVENYATRSPFEWIGAPAEMLETAAPGDEAKIVFRVRKVRSECHTVPHLMRFEVVDAAGESFLVNQRSGIPNDLPMGSFEREVTFEVPRFAVPGQAYARMHWLLVCEWPPGIDWTVAQSLPPIVFNIEGN